MARRAAQRRPRWPGARRPAVRAPLERRVHRRTLGHRGRPCGKGGQYEPGHHRGDGRDREGAEHHARGGHLGPPGGLLVRPEGSDHEAERRRMAFCRKNSGCCRPAVDRLLASGADVAVADAIDAVSTAHTASAHGRDRAPEPGADPAPGVRDHQEACRARSRRSSRWRARKRRSRWPTTPNTIADPRQPVRPAGRPGRAELTPAELIPGAGRAGGCAAATSRPPSAGGRRPRGCAPSCRS